MEEKKNINKCKFSFFDYDFKINKGKYTCFKNEEPLEVNEETCEGCSAFDSRYIEYPLTVNEIENNFNNEHMFSLYKPGKYVKIRPCNEKYKDKTYLGILLGELPVGAVVGYYSKTGNLSITPQMNPAIWVPDLNKIIYGYESWWGIIDSEEDFKEITDLDIENVWYVKALREMTGGTLCEGNDKKEKKNTE